MTVAPTTPPFDAPAVVRSSVPPGRTSPAPDLRELRSIAIAGGVVALAAAVNLGELALSPWLPETMEGLTMQHAFLLVIARFTPWILGLLALSVPFALRWTPRAHQRLVEPTLIAAWVTLFIAVAVAIALGRYGVWPWRWATTHPETASLLSTFLTAELFAPVLLWLVLSCLLVPLLLELFFRFGVIEWLLSRGVTTWMAVAIAAVAFGATWLTGLTASPGAALRHAAIGTILGGALGALVIRGRRGRGLGLAIIAHGAFVGVELAVLLGVGQGWR